MKACVVGIPSLMTVDFPQSGWPTGDAAPVPRTLMRDLAALMETWLGRHCPSEMVRLNCFVYFLLLSYLYGKIKFYDQITYIRGKFYERKL
jgi:hypothetical protein